MSNETIAQSASLERVREQDNWKPRFFTIWVGQSISQIGSSLTQFVLIWWITSTTGSATALAFASLMGMLPHALFAPLGGILADRWSRRWIMIISDSITAISMLVLVLLFRSGNVELWQIYLIMFVRSTMQAFQGPAATASTTMLVPNSWLTRVSGMNQTISGLMLVASAPLGALALAFFPLEGALMIDVATAFFGIVPLFFLHIPQPKRHDMQQSSAWQDFRAGLSLVLKNHGLLWMYALSMIIVMVLIPAFAIVPLFVKNDFGGGVNEVAIIEGFGGLGMLIGGVLISIFSFRTRRIYIVLAGFAVSCFAIMLTGLAPSNMFWLAVFWWFLSGVPYTMGNGPIIAIMQNIVPPHMQGRALSLYSSCMNIAGPIGLLLITPLGEVVSARWLIVAGGAFATIFCVIGFFIPSLVNIEQNELQA